MIDAKYHGLATVITVLFLSLASVSVIAGSEQDESKASTSEGVSKLVMQTTMNNPGNDMKTLTNGKAINGNWQQTPLGYQAQGSGDNWMVFDTELPTDEPFIYEADLQLSRDQFAAGVIFGVREAAQAGARPYRWYCVNVVPKYNVTNVFSQLDGHTEWNDSRALTDSEQKSGLYHVRIEYLGNRKANFYLNNTLIVSRDLPAYDGGKLGLMLYEAKAEFSNMRFQPANAPKLDDIKLIAPKMNLQFFPDTHTYWAKAPHSLRSVEVAANAASSFELTINGQGSASKHRHTVMLEDGNNPIKVAVREPQNGLTDTYVINIIREPNPKTLYKEKTRPQLHFTPYMYPMNDPNGLVYNEVTKEYHLYFQCNRPFDTGLTGLPGSGTTSWGHAVSKDLMNWQEYPLVLTPDRLGCIWSGSCVIDRNNTSGFFDASTPPGSRMVAFYTSAGGDMSFGFGKESVAYSKDGGYTWVKYPGNPVVRNAGDVYGGGLRDPKVIWYADASMPGCGIWVMVTAIDSHIFTSRNLVDWKHSAPILDRENKPFEAECPDLFPMAIDGNPRDIKWVFSAAGVFYLIGHMEKTGIDTVRFVAESDKIEPLKGVHDVVHGISVGEPYAMQTFYNDPKARRISIAWLRDKYLKWNDKNWESAQTLPLEIKLRRVGGELQLYRYPAEEVDAMRVKKPILSLRKEALDSKLNDILSTIQTSLADIEATITLGSASEVGFRLRMDDGKGEHYVEVKYDKTKEQLVVDKSHSDPGFVPLYFPKMSVQVDGKIRLRVILDRTCLDAFGNDGEAAVSALDYSEPENEGISMFANGSATVDVLKIYKMRNMRRSVPHL